MRTEIKADLAAELDMVKLLVAGAVTAVFGVNLLLVSAVFALAGWMPGWLASLGQAALLLAARSSASRLRQLRLSRKPRSRGTAATRMRRAHEDSRHLWRGKA